MNSPTLPGWPSDEFVVSGAFSGLNVFATYVASESGTVAFLTQTATLYQRR